MDEKYQPRGEASQFDVPYIVTDKGSILSTYTSEQKDEDGNACAFVIRREREKDCVIVSWLYEQGAMKVTFTRNPEKFEKWEENPTARYAVPGDVMQFEFDEKGILLHSVQFVFDAGQHTRCSVYKKGLEKKDEWSFMSYGFDRGTGAIARPLQKTFERIDWRNELMLFTSRIDRPVFKKLPDVPTDKDSFTKNGNLELTVMRRHIVALIRHIEKGDITKEFIQNSVVELEGFFDSLKEKAFSDNRKKQMGESLTGAGARHHSSEYCE